MAEEPPIALTRNNRRLTSPCEVRHPCVASFSNPFLQAIRMAVSSENNGDQHEFELCLVIFSVSAALIGVCLTGIGLLQVVRGLSRVTTVGDEILAVDAFLFLVTCALAFLSFRARSARRRVWLRKTSDVTFFLGLLLLAAVCALIAFSVLS